MIAPDAEPVGHVSPYKRIDPRYPGRKQVITALEVAEAGGRTPDAAIYRFDVLRNAWILRDGV